MCTTPPPPPRTFAITAHTCLHTDKLCNNTTQHVSMQHTHIHPTQHHLQCYSTCAHTPVTSQQTTRHATNQPTNQPAKPSFPRIHPPTNNQQTQQPTKQPENQQLTNQQARYECTQRGGGLHNLGGGGIKHTTHTAQLLTLQQYTGQPHTTNTHGREEGRSNTPTSCGHRVPTSSPQSKKPAHLQRGNGYPP